VHERWRLHGVASCSDVGDERLQALGTSFSFGRVAATGVVDRGCDAADRDGGDDASRARGRSRLHVQALLVGQHQAAQYLPYHIDAGRRDNGRGEKVAAALGLIHVDRATHARQTRVGVGSPARCTAR
jgi:hypothetical protein